MSERAWIRLVAGIAFCVAGIVSPAVRSDPLKIRFHDQSRYREEGILRFVVEAADEEAPVEGLKQATWGLLHAGKPVAIEKADVTEFRTQGSATAVLVILAANANFLPPAEEAGKDGTRAKTPMEYALDALDSLKNNLGNARISVACYDEFRREPEILVTGKTASKMEALALDAVAQCRSVDQPSKGGMPRLPTVLSAAAQKWLDKVPVEVRRHVIVIITDGNSEEPVSDTWIRSIRNRFGAEGTKGWLEWFVFGLEDGGNASNIKALAKDGILSITDKRENLPREVSKRLPLIAGAGIYDVSFRLSDRVTGASVPLVVTVQGSEGKFESEPYPLVNLERKIGWLRIVFLILGILLGLVLVYLIIRLIAAAVEARRRRREEEAARAAAPYDGPSRGRLIVRDGPAAGQTFHLVEDMTYIGRSPDNHICIPDGSVGKRHASIHIKNRTYEIEDLQSVNGVFVNGQRVLKAHLRDGDSIRLGSSEMQFRL